MAWQIDRETGRPIGMVAILANEPSCLRAEIGEVFGAQSCVPRLTLTQQTPRRGVDENRDPICITMTDDMWYVMPCVMRDV